MDRRSFVIGTAALAAAGASRAQEAFPARAITMINAFPPGGANDIATRPFASALEPIIKQPVVVETKAGAGGQVGAQVAANAKPDGYTLLSHNNGISGYEDVDRLFGRQPKTTPADFIPLARLVADPILVLVNDTQPYKIPKDLVDDAKARPKAIGYSSGGLYGATHLPVALLGNNAQLSTQSTSASLPHIKAGKLRALASFGGTRSHTLPDVPTLRELGYDVEYYLWVGIFAPKGTPANALAVLNAAIGKAVEADQYKQAITNLGLDPAFLGSADFAKFWQDDIKHAKEAVALIGRQG